MFKKKREGNNPLGSTTPSGKNEEDNKKALAKDDHPAFRDDPRFSCHLNPLISASLRKSIQRTPLL